VPTIGQKSDVFHIGAMLIKAIDNLHPGDIPDTDYGVYIFRTTAV
jgi:hypothetical protein